MKVAGTGNYGIYDTSRAYNSAGQVSRERASPRRFDSIMLSTGDAAKSDIRRKELTSRIAGEVRTSTSSADIRELRDLVENGEYEVDPERIARSILLYA